MTSEEEMRIKIEALEQENKALRSAANSPRKNKVVIVTEGSYQGHPTLTFEAGGRPFTLGLRKVSVVLHCSEFLRDIVSRHKSELLNWEIVKGTSENNDRSSDQI